MPEGTSKVGRNGGGMLSAVEIAHHLGLNPPTDEQIRIIESPLEPRLVIAGAGSGKTATMVDRVVWLVANGLVRADEVLGVTFTRKAAGELRERMRTRLNILRERHLIEVSEEELLEGASEPTVSTYHSYANTLVKDYGLRLGVEQDAQMLGQAQSWQLAAQVVQYWEGELPAGGRGGSSSKTAIIGQMLKLASECAEHLVSAQQVIEFCTAQCAAYESLGAPGSKKYAGQIIEKLRAKIILARMVQRYERVKARMQVLDYGDLILLAARIAREIPQAAELERQRYRVVLLDEFQDTSHAQLQLFADLFGTRPGAGGQGEHPVMAVGDPKQSIYGFRGASDGQLFSFYRYFPTRDQTPLYLSVAWRNDVAVLDAANLVASPLKNIPDWVRAPAPPAVPDLRPRSVVTCPDTAGWEAMAGSVQLARYSTEDDEGRGIAQRIAAERARYAQEPAAMPTMAVLTRTRAQMEPVRQACEAAGIPVQVVGLGGLLSRPEVVDVVSMLRVLADPGRSDALVRLLAGARWRLGTADLLALGDWSNELTRERGFSVGVAGAPQTVEDVAEYGSLIEAVEHLPGASTLGESVAEADGSGTNPVYPEHYRGRRFSAEGLRRLRAFAGELEYLRQFTTDDLGTLLYEIERVMLLDIELAVHAAGDSYASRAHLDAFHEVAATYTNTAPRINAVIYAGADGVAVDDDAPSARRFVLSASGVSYLLGFLVWLDQADEREGGLEQAPQQPRRDAVQILTMHASKGLEWDQVYLPRMADGGRVKHHIWQLSEQGVLPWPLRGDREYLPPVLESPQTVSALENFSELNAAVEEGEEQVRDYAGFESRRLTYVAMTRARSLLYVSNCRWVGANIAPATTSPYWNELVQFAQPAQHGRSAPGASGLCEKAPYEGIQRAPWLYPGFLGTGYHLPQWARFTDPSIDAVYGRDMARLNWRLSEPARLVNGTVLAPVAGDDAPAAVARALYTDGGDPVANARILGLPQVNAVCRSLHPGQDFGKEFDHLDAFDEREAERVQALSGSARGSCEQVRVSFARIPLERLVVAARGSDEGGEHTGDEGTAAEEIRQPVRPQIVRRLLDASAWSETNPQQGSVLTAMWPFDPFDGPQVLRWDSEQALVEGMHGTAPGARQVQQVSVPNHRRQLFERAARRVVNPDALQPGDESASPADARTAEQIADWQQEVELLLALAHRAVTPQAPAKPEHLSASELIALAQDSQQMMDRMVRPVPVRPSAAARSGTVFHEWVEQYFGVEPMLDLGDEFYADDDADAGLSLDVLRQRFLASEWASRTMWRAEYPVETHVAGVSVRGRIDAVFRTVESVDGVPVERWELVDWKTGRKPNARQMRYKRIQLALYRLAFAKIQGVDPATVRAAFYYVGSDQTVWDTDIADGLPSEQQLQRIITRQRWVDE